MMTKKTGLGKGLDALFSTPINNTEDNVNEKKSEKKDDNIVIKEIKLNEIEPNRNQARKVFEEEALDELAESIKEYGVIQPIIVTKKDGYYEIVAGERRWRASKKAGMKTIPAIVRDDNTRENMEISLIENVQREDLNPIEKARGLRTLMDGYNLTQEQVAKKIGKSRSVVANSVRLLNLDERVMKLALEGKLSEGHCISLLSIEDKDDQYKMAEYLVETGETVRDAGNKIKRANKLKKINKNDKTRDTNYTAIYKDIEDQFRGFFGTKVKLDAGVRSGKIIIKYSSNEDLERILGLLK